MTYTDPTTGEYVGEFERPCLLNAGEVHRDTEWFATDAAARRFSRTGNAFNMDPEWDPYRDRAVSS